MDSSTTLRLAAETRRSESCPRCHEVYEIPTRLLREDDLQFSHIPKLLDCLHTYCQSCIQDQTERSPAPHGFVCGVCGRRQPIADLVSGTSNLPNDYRALSQLRRQLLERNDAFSCEECFDDVRACMRCIQCGIALCPFHMENHRRSRLYKTHTLVQLGKATAVTTSTGPPGPTLPDCLRHDSVPLELYCQDCEQLACARCRAEEHMNHCHAVLPVTTAASSKRRILDGLLKKMQLEIQGLHQSVEKITVCGGQVTKNAADTRALIKQCFLDIRKELDARESALLETLDRLTEKQLESLARRNGAARNTLAELSSVGQFAETSANLGDAEFLGMWRPIWRKCEGLTIGVPDDDDSGDLSVEAEKIDFVYRSSDKDLFISRLQKFGAILNETDAAAYCNSSRTAQQAGGREATVPDQHAACVEFIVRCVKVDGDMRRRRSRGGDQLVVEVRQLQQKESDDRGNMTPSPHSTTKTQDTNTRNRAEGLGRLLGHIILGVELEGAGVKRTGLALSTMVDSFNDNLPTLRIRKTLRIP